jgi:hypothetical protein
MVLRFRIAYGGKMGRRGRRRKQLLDDLKEKRRYWKMKEEALDRTLWRTRFGRGYGPVVRQTTEWMNEWMNGGNLLPQNKVVMSFHYPMFQSPCILSWRHWQYNWWHIKVHWHFISTSCLAEDVIVHFLKSYHTLPKRNKLALKVCWEVMSKRSSTKKQPIPPHHTYTPTTSAGQKLILREVVWFGKRPCLIFYCLPCNQHLSFSLQVYRLSSYLFCCVEMFILGVTARSSGEVCIYELLLLLPPSLCVCFCNTELSSCIAIVHFLGAVSHFYFKTGVITSPDQFGTQSAL